MLTAQKFWEVWGKSDALYTAWASSQNINPNQLFVLYALDRQDAVTQKMIVEYTGLSKQTVNTVIRALKADGYITLRAGSADRREKQVVLTDMGQAKSRKLLLPLYTLENRVFDIMGAERVKQMIDTITLFNTVFEKEMMRK